MVPADLATIYNLNPLFTDLDSGQGQTIVVAEDTDVYSTADWTAFRSTFGLSSYTAGSLTQVHPSGAATCIDPGVVDGDEFEAELDAEWASAAAPSAAIVVASCAGTDGVLIAVENLVNESSPPAIISISYGECEAENGATANGAYNTIYQQAAGEGISVFVAAGDEGAAGCDADVKIATHGVGVNAYASTPYNVAVGGTDFGDTYAGTTSSYWSSTNSSTYGSALSYIPEIPWNDSCAGALLASYEGDSPSYGSNGFCNKAPVNPEFQTTASGSGGPSGCATGSPSRTGVVGGSCKGNAKPTWQSLAPGNPSDGVRDLPDVSLFA
ncbi:MAG: peptidase S53 propeptide, partial [Steroidobacteraceae bacterium]